MTNNAQSRPTVLQDYHEEQSTFEITCSGNDDDRAAPKDAPLATGLLTTTNGEKYLITNWHVVTGRHPANDEQIGMIQPRVLFVRESVLSFGIFTTHRIRLYNDEGASQWRESSRRVRVEGIEQRIDLAAIPFPSHSTVTVGINLDDTRKEQYVPRPLDHVSIIGFPFHRERPIWKTAHVAESVQPYKDYFLVNSRTKRGMSGSGVFSTSMHLYDNATKVQNQLLLGIYSGRYADTEIPAGRRATEKELNELDLGIVWKIDLIKSMLGERP